MSFTTILIKALTNTVLGMGTVFLVLIFIAFLISLLPKLTAIIESVGKKKKAVLPATTGNQVPVISGLKTAGNEKSEKQTDEEFVDDLELAAVITAAIAAAEMLPADGFVVRSIRRSTQNQWKKA